jgi:WD40 repeat protein
VASALALHASQCDLRIHGHCTQGILAVLVPAYQNGADAHLSQCALLPHQCVYTTAANLSVAQCISCCCAQVVYSPDGRRLFTAGSDGVICVHDATRSDYAPIKMLATDAAATAGSVISLGVSPDSQLLAVVGIEVRARVCLLA